MDPTQELCKLNALVKQHCMTDKPITAVLRMDLCRDHMNNPGKTALKHKNEMINALNRGVAVRGKTVRIVFEPLDHASSVFTTQSTYDYQVIAHVVNLANPNRMGFPVYLSKPIYYIYGLDD